MSKESKIVDSYKLKTDESIDSSQCVIVCEETGRKFSSTMQLARVLNVYEESVLKHLRCETDTLMGGKYFRC